MEEEENCYWHDESKAQIHVLHIPSGKIKKIKGTKKADHINYTGRL
jgi:hypothetical protein